jgi:hypothetical protein
MISPKLSNGNKFTIVGGKVYDEPIELPERITAPDPRFDFKLTYEYDDLGRVKTEREFKNDGKLQRLYTFKYDANGKIKEETINYRSSITKTTYTYDKKGILIEELSESQFKGTGSGNTYKDTYSEYELDSHGNWTSRKVEVLYFDGVSDKRADLAKYDNVHIERRTITYY